MRDLLIILSMCLAAIAVGAWLYFYSPSEVISHGQPQVVAGVEEAASAKEVAPEEMPVSFSVLAHGSKAIEVLKRKNYAVYDKDEYARIWKLTGSKDSMPTVDFQKGYVIAVFAGTKATGGYAISVEKVTDINDSRHISVLIEKPGVGCITTQALTSPFQIIRVPFSGASLSHTDVEKEVPCNK